MLFFHIVDDYYSQGILSFMKQKTWWKKQTSNPLYKNDYIMALCEHAFSWTFMIFLPLFVSHFFGIQLNEKFIIILFCFNWGIHVIVDDLKANQQKINLIADQLIHIGQVIITGIILLI
jgi:hypothetical protein